MNGEEYHTCESRVVVLENMYANATFININHISKNHPAYYPYLVCIWCWLLRHFIARLSDRSVKHTTRSRLVVIFSRHQHRRQTIGARPRTARAFVFGYSSVLIHECQILSIYTSLC